MRIQCCGYIVADINVFPFAQAHNLCRGHKICIQDTRNISDLCQKHFVSATNDSLFVWLGLKNYKPKIHLNRSTYTT